MENPQERISTENVLLSLKEGNINAYMIICEQYHSRVYCFALSFLKSEEISREITADVFTEIWERRSEIDTDAFSPFLMSVCSNRVYKKLRSTFNEGDSRESLWNKMNPGE
ncbi:sigma factor [Sinomicrobium sp. M5D2P17]